MITGNGCFKCGSTDHIAKDCVGGNQPSKFIVKDQNRQHGGGKGYDMVFEGDIPASPKREKREHSHDREKIRRRSPHGYGEGKRQHRDERDTEDKAAKYNGRRQDREEVRERDRDRRYGDGVSREKKHTERNERDSREDEDRRRRRRRDEMRDSERRVERRRDRDDDRNDRDYKERRIERDSGNGREARDDRRDRERAR